MHLCVNTKADFKNSYIYKYCLRWQPLSEVLLAMAGSKKMKKTVVFAVHLKPLAEKTSQNTVFSTRSLKSDVFGRFSPLTLQKQRKNQCVAKYRVFWCFWSKIFDLEQEQQQQQQQQQQQEHMTPCNLGAGGPCRGAA